VPMNTMLDASLGRTNTASESMSGRESTCTSLTGSCFHLLDFYDICEYKQQSYLYVGTYSKAYQAMLCQDNR
jgi:hypothetical protein